MGGTETRRKPSQGGIILRFLLYSVFQRCGLVLFWMTRCPDDPISRSQQVIPAIDQLSIDHACLFGQGVRLGWLKIHDVQDRVPVGHEII